MDKFIEITQDSAGVIEKKNQDVTGFYTGGIQSCLVTVYECADAHVIIHDSGQLKINDICGLIKRFGKVEQITATFGPNLNSEHHQQRFNEILQAIEYIKNVDVLQCPYTTFDFQYPLHGKPSYLTSTTPDYVEKIPDKDTRISIIELNNFFLEPNSQNLELDIQYINDSYQEPKGLDYSLDEMLEIIKKQPDFFFLNLAFLAKANQIGLVKLTDNLIEIVERHQVLQFISKQMTPQELATQKDEFMKFIGIT